jgi:hypothetical protein
MNEILMNTVYRWSRKANGALVLETPNKNSAKSFRTKRRFNKVSLAFFPFVGRPVCRRSARNLSTVKD